MDKKRMIGIQIAETRSRKGMTQEQLASKMDISTKYLSSIERGKENPTLNTLINLSEALDTDLGDILGFVEVEDPSKRKLLLESLLKKADDEQLKLALRILKNIVV